MFEQIGDVLTVKELCAVLRIGRNKAYELLEQGAIFHIRVGRKYLIPKSALYTYLHIQNPNDCCTPTPGGLT